ncbi:MAG: hypothetical protein JO025_26985 [Verrucomicrobia bacterium]|nr:hypothetical protein [Verrucomicrobiota bacterium]
MNQELRWLIYGYHHRMNRKPVLRFRYDKLLPQYVAVAVLIGDCVLV